MTQPNTKELTQKKCLPCEGGVPKLTKAQAEQYLSSVPGWQLNRDGTSMNAQYVMKDFQAALNFINAIGKIAEDEGHHPDLHLTGYRRLSIDLNTHAIGGLSENDFILAAKINQLPRELKK
ncbi:MAG: pterin-4-alpha-carbinolamine dehydratase [Candidatus Omnitrophica bacterium CG11_big_fil_rev_8_21_14_0_20_45_26]|uniref:4a-hydroxytetrahydrobiopterin dehydratase n=1 Tax=Candidatus Abzuiibacterium crystallinum TaxID=1974748 RepID=A0A2H0LMZ9_9BACT|nr:MAG: pterin-4-alpha-carbinolamine dehydratase [Candidatus Omnitrophica bacterium CG11_big_fil_rev_8_21_14_0_20_45_26]PIW65503.1 MAG: pterin-4-alpha-carbinolamine dehydratase [Candidatus Omnitrophica bacterium CG12_big_fil_rev_8_21_14_0_65_45_16]